MSAEETHAVQEERPAPAAEAVPGTHRRKVFYGWWIVGASAYTNGIGGSTHWQGFTVLFLPVAASLNLGHALTALPFSLSRAEGAITGPLTGWLIDRFGVKPLMLVGTILVGVGYILLSQTSTYLGFLLIYILVISLGASTSFMQATTASLNQWFIRHRGISMSINSAAFRLGGSFIVPLLSLGVLAYGWQTASMWVGIGMLVLIAPAALLFRRSPESMGLRPDGDEPRGRSGEASPARPGSRRALSTVTYEDWGVKEALRTRAFYMLALGTVLRMAVHGAIFIHLVPILVWKGEGQQAAANMIGLLALVSVPLIMLFGWLSDRVGRSRLLFIAYASSGISLLLLNQVDGTVVVFLALLLFAGSEAGSALNWAIVGDMFGRRNFATLRGIISPMYNVALLITPFAAGLVYDVTGSYQPVLLAGAGLMFAAAVVFLLLRPPGRRREATA